MILLQTNPHPMAAAIFYKGKDAPHYHLKFSIFEKGVASTFEFDISEEIFKSLGNLQDKKFELVLSTVEESTNEGE